MTEEIITPPDDDEDVVEGEDVKAGEVPLDDAPTTSEVDDDNDDEPEEAAPDA